MILPVTAKNEDYKICKQPYITSILRKSVFVRNRDIILIAATDEIFQ